MLHLRKVLGAKPKEHVEVELAQMMTPWGEALDIEHVLEEHPDPQFARTSFCTLNGSWDCTFAESGHDAAGDLLPVVRQAPIPNAGAFDQQIVVPFSPEAPLSGINRQLKPDELLWYRRSFQTPSLQNDERALLHFQAVDYACAVYVNGQFVGAHAGGYTPFCFDVTNALADAASANELLVCVADSSEAGSHPRGKQRFDRGDIWYTAQSGIWQSVWLETVPDAHISSITLEADPESGIVSLGAKLVCPEGEPIPALALEVFDENDHLIASDRWIPDESTCALAAHIENARLWSPDDPYLYRLRITFGRDVVASYCGFRTVKTYRDAQGRMRVLLNGKPLFIRGVLDQAYWSDGLMTAPADDALVFDIEAMRKAGFNLMRKHIKLEAARWYYHCDRLGMLVLQDMVSGGDTEIRTWQWSYKPTLFKISWNHYRDDTDRHREELGAGSAAFRQEWASLCCETIRLLGNHPCIIGWSLFNEGWGQFDAVAMTRMVREQDPTRLIDATSGWYDQGCGDFYSVHNYFRDMKVWRDGARHSLGARGDKAQKRAFFVSEFGGFTHRVDGHAALDEAYGYEPYDDRDEWRQAVHTLLKSMDALEPDGLAGYVFTQVSDIEEETNGILTYDRRVNKLE